MANKKKYNSDVIIVGGGLAGLSLTALLASNNVRVHCIDRDAPLTQLHESFDGRTTAISYGSQKLLAAAGIWESLIPHACPINTIQILDGDSPVLLQFDSPEVRNNKFGWIIENRLIRHALFNRIQKLKNATHIAPATVNDFDISENHASVHLDNGENLNAPLIIGADGRNSFTREWMGINTRHWSYKQKAIVCCVTHENPHNHIAVEHFRAAGPFATLPMTDTEDGKHRSSVVWTQHGPDRNSAMHYSDEAFNAALNNHFPDFYGKVELLGRRFQYPLGLIHAHKYIAPRMALIAEAAHGIHPIAGQGLNMGLRDVAAISDLIIQAVKNSADPGTPELLENYQRQRRADNMGMAAATDHLNKLFSNDFPPLSILRKAGLRAVSKIKPAKRFFMHQAMGMTGQKTGLLPSLLHDQDEQKHTGKL